MHFQGFTHENVNKCLLLLFFKYVKKDFAKSRTMCVTVIYVPMCPCAHVPMCQCVNVPKACQLLNFTCQRVSKPKNMPTS